MFIDVMMRRPLGRRRTLLNTVLLSGGLLSMACAPADPPGFETTGHYTTKTPYPAPTGQPELPVPEGFRPLMVQLAARHGSRPLSSPDDDDLSLQVWRQAADEEALTPLGLALGPVLEDIRRVHQDIGYGAISGRGILEHEEMARRLVQRQRRLFDETVDSGREIDVQHSGRLRAEQSAGAFVRGLESGMPELSRLIAAPRPEPELVYFNDAADTPAARAYRVYRESDARLLATVERLSSLPRTRDMAQRLLEALYTPAFVARLDAGVYRFEAAADPEDVIDDAVGAAASLYALYSIAVNLDVEGDWNLGRFLDPQAVAWFAMVDDAESFYERGPGFADEDVTWRAAEVLLRDFVSGIEAAAAGDIETAAVLRFTHAQALIPFAALLGIEGAHEALPEGVLFDYDNSPWRASEVSPMAANVQWEAYLGSDGRILVRMLHNERLVPFAGSCRPSDGAPGFYALEEIRRCYGLSGP